MKSSFLVLLHLSSLIFSFPQPIPLPASFARTPPDSHSLSALFLKGEEATSYEIVVTEMRHFYAVRASSLLISCLSFSWLSWNSSSTDWTSGLELFLKLSIIIPIRHRTEFTTVVIPSFWLPAASEKSLIWEVFQRFNFRGCCGFMERSLLQRLCSSVVSTVNPPENLRSDHSSPVANFINADVNSSLLTCYQIKT